MKSSTAIKDIRPEFVDAVPRELASGVLYVSIPFNTTIHLCACGCGRQVVAPLRPSRFRLTYDGERIWMRPSIGNWSFPCRSHYWIRGNRIEWSWTFTDDEIAEAQELHDWQVDEEFK